MLLPRSRFCSTVLHQFQTSNMSEQNESANDEETPIYDGSPSNSDDDSSKQDSIGSHERPEHFTDDPAVVHETAQSPASDTNVDCMLVSMLVVHIPKLCSRWQLCNQRKKSKVVDKDPALKRSLQVTFHHSLLLVRLACLGFLLPFLTYVSQKLILRLPFFATLLG